MASIITYLHRFFLLIILILSLITQVLSYCRDFKQSRNYYTTAAENEQIISKGYVCERPNSIYSTTDPIKTMCNSTGECPTETKGLVNNIGTNNLSLSRDDVLPLYDLIPKKTYFNPPSFLYSLSGNVTSIQSCLTAHTANKSEGDTSTAGYYLFVPTLLCIEGTLRQCDNGPVEDDTPIQLCAVNALDLGAKGIVPNGVQRWVATDVETAHNMTRNPALTAEGIPTQAGISLSDLGIEDYESNSYRHKPNEVFFAWAILLTISLLWI